MGFIHSLLEQPEESREVFLAALDLDENDPDIYTGLGQASFDLGEFEESAHYFEKSALLSDKLTTWMLAAEAPRSIVSSLPALTLKVCPSV